jgi:hypothetical protein
MPFAPFGGREVSVLVLPNAFFGAVYTNFKGSYRRWQRLCLIQERKAENEECPKVYWLVGASNVLRVVYG